MSVGMPHFLYLQEFGSQIFSAFDAVPYLVGSAATEKSGWRDVDVRLILDDEIYEFLQLGEPCRGIHNARWVSLCLAYSALGKQITGLPIDFQLQQRTWANETFPGQRIAMAFVPWRIKP